MADHDTAAAVREAAPGVCVIDISGDVTSASESVPVAAYADTVRRGASAVALSFAALDYMNCGGIGLPVMLLVRAQRQERRVLGDGLSERYRQTFELTRLDEAAGIHDSEAAALAAAGVGA